MARRLATWTIDEKKISNSQKGFLPFEGCLQHSFLLQSVFEDSKSRKRNARVVWLDLKNAFGSVPHHTMWEMMECLDIPAYFKSVCKEIYSHCTQKIRCKEGFTNEIPVSRGIKQGCPLSPLLFNLVLEGILPELEKTGGYKLPNGSMVRVLAYADDICILSHSKEDIQEMLNKINDFAKWAGLNFNPAKCGALSMINNSNRKYVEHFQPKLGPDLLPALKWEDHYRYLGVQSGRQRSGTKKGLEESLTLDASKILDSGLTEWQKIDAISTFLLTKANYNLNASVLDRTWATRIDAKIRRLVKKAMRLPRRTVSTFFHTTKDHGGLGHPWKTPWTWPESPDSSAACQAQTDLSRTQYGHSYRQWSKRDKRRWKLTPLTLRPSSTPCHPTRGV